MHTAKRVKADDLPIGMKVVWLAAGVNFASFLILSGMYGGSALNGKIEGGKFYVANHGRYTEVTESTFRFSLIHSMTAFGLIFVAVLGTGWISHYRSARTKRPDPKR
jgi:hypothetical protein